MPIKRHTDRNNRLTTLTATGEITPEELIEIVGAFAFDPPALHILWDVREAVPARSLHADHMSEIASLAKSAIGSRYTGKTAYVAASELVFGICERFTVQLEHKGAFHQTKVFHDIDEALAWLQQTENPPPPPPKDVDG